jgi:hypothetical protein
MLRIRKLRAEYCMHSLNVLLFHLFQGLYYELVADFDFVLITDPFLGWSWSECSSSVFASEYITFLDDVH